MDHHALTAAPDQNKPLTAALIALWNINPFDQFGVELGKTMAADIHQKMIAARTDAA